MFIGASAFRAIAAPLLDFPLLMLRARSFTVTSLATDRLPIWLASLLADRTVLSAFAVPERRRIIVWVLDGSAHNSHEIEYSTRSWNPISLGRRMKELPHKRHFKFGRYAISLKYHFDEMNRLIEEAVVTRGKSDLLRKTHPFYLEISFAPRGQAAERFAPLLKAAEAEWEYDRSPDPTKIASWVRKLYRRRRQQVESGLDPDHVFDDLRTAVTQRDPAASALIPGIIETLASVEGEDSAGLWARYCARAETGARELTRPDAPQRTQFTWPILRPGRGSPLP